MTTFKSRLGLALGLVLLGGTTYAGRLRFIANTG